MDQKRAQTLEALEAFIQAQKTLLDSTYSDIERLREAKAAAIADPISFVANLHANLDAPPFQLSAAVPDWQVVIPNGIDWSVFEGHDPTPLQKFTLDAQHAYVSRNEPHSFQKSPLSELQKLVKSARRSIIDPVLTAFSQQTEEEDESESEIDEEEAFREREREKIKLLKQRKIRTCGSLKLPRGIGGGIGIGGSNAVFVRHDVEDESMDVDITLDPDELSTDHHHRYTSSSITPQVQVSPPPQPLPSRLTLEKPFLQSKVSRSRRPTFKKKDATATAEFYPDSRSRRKKARKAKGKDDTAPKPPPPTEPRSSSPITKTRLLQQQEEEENTTISITKTGKPRPETYKQAWSVSEQHLLDRLLEQIPEGEKNRWQKISRAMNGRRTPRQVASRVQKLFEKMKQHGL